MRARRRKREKKATILKRNEVNKIIWDMKGRNMSRKRRKTMGEDNFTKQMAIQISGA